jgi:MFS transporter, DHA1 family, inner membrane transport protein
VILYVLMLCSFAVATAEFVLVGLLPEISTELAVSLPAAGFLVTVYMIVGTIGGPAAVVLTRRMPRRTALILAMALALASAVLSALAPSYGVLLAGRLGSALAQSLFVAVASQVAMAAVPPERQTAAVAKVFNGFALATVIGLPVGTLVGHAFGWHATFAAVAVLAAAGLAGVLLSRPGGTIESADSLRRSAAAILAPRLLLGLAITVLAFTGFVAAFTYVAPMLRETAGLSAGWVGAALVVYGLGTLAGSALAGRVKPAAIVAVLPVPLALMGVVLLVQGIAMHHPVPAVASLFLMGASGFLIAPLVQTWLMSEAGPAAAGLAAAVNISVFGLAGAIGASLGGAVLSTGHGLDRVSPVAAVPVLVATALAVALRLRGRTPRQSTVDAVGR